MIIYLKDKNKQDIYVIALSHEKYITANDWWKDIIVNSIMFLRLTCDYQQHEVEQIRQSTLYVKQAIQYKYCNTVSGTETMSLG